MRNINDLAICVYLLLQKYLLCTSYVMLLVPDTRTFIYDLWSNVVVLLIQQFRR